MGNSEPKSDNSASAAVNSNSNVITSIDNQDVIVDADDDDDLKQTIHGTKVEVSLHRSLW